MKQFITLSAIAALFSLPVLAGDIQSAYFDFANPESLNPSIETPALKEAIPLDGKEFTDGEVSVSFHATGTGNTQVRLYGSYDAGCNLRVYDGDSFVVETLENRGLSSEEVFITEIAFDIALSGSVPDVDLIPDVGEYDWMTCVWSAGEENVKKVTLTSNQQSRISNMKVSLSLPSGITTISPDEENVSYFTIDGQPAKDIETHGLYIGVSGNRTFKILK